MGFKSFIEGLAKKASLPRYRETADRYLEISRKFPDDSHAFWLGQLLGMETRIKTVNYDLEHGRRFLIWMIAYGLKTARATRTPIGRTSLTSTVLLLT